MTNVLVRDIPEPVHAVLVERAKRNGQSLQQYLVRELQLLAETPTRDEVLDRIGRRTGGKVGFAQAVRDIEADRR